MRWLILSLLFLNFASFLWYWRDSRPESEPVAVQVQGDDLPVASLQLLDERDSVVPDVESVPEPDQENQLLAAGQEPGCFQLEGFADTSQAEGFVAAYAENFALSIINEEIAGNPAYRVYLSPAESRSAANAALQELRARLLAESLNIDSFVISSGELENAISLGLFSERSNALNVERQMTVLGYQVVLAEQPGLRQRYLVLLAEQPGNPSLADLWAQISPSYPQVQPTEKLCETIAHEF